MNIKSPIGIFDSGVGGLTVMSEIRRLLPFEDIIYVGDTARLPYGSKDKETLIGYGREIINFLLEKGAKAIVLACGTSSSTSFDALKEEFPNLTLVDTIRPSVRAAAETAATHPRICFIATAATVKTGLFTRLLLQECPEATIHSRACPLFAPMVEMGLAAKNHPLLHFTAETYLGDLCGEIDAMVLGCTHYPLLTNILTDVMGEILFINPAAATALATKDLLAEKGLINSCSKKGKVTFYTSGSIDAFSRTARSILNEEITPLKVNWC